MPTDTEREISTRLGKLETDMTTVLARLPPDLPVRLDRLEQAEEGRKDKFKAMWTAVITAIVAAIASLAHAMFGGGKQ